jgi:hypothetical protein
MYDHVEPLEKSKLETLGWGWWGCNNNLPKCNNILETMAGDTFEWFPRGRPSSSADSCQVRPPFGKVKCNVDAAFGDNKGGIDMCICDHNGNFVQATLPCLVWKKVKHLDCYKLYNDEVSSLNSF